MSTALCQEIEALLAQTLSISHLELRDDSHKHAHHQHDQKSASSASSNKGGHILLLLVSPAFEGKNRLQRSQMVYQALKFTETQMLHALSMRLFGPAEWNDFKGAQHT